MEERMDKDELIGHGKPEIIARLTLELDQFGGLMVDGVADPNIQVRMAEKLIEGVKDRAFGQYLAVVAQQQKQVIAAPASALNGLQKKHKAN